MEADGLRAEELSDEELLATYAAMRGRRRLIDRNGAFALFRPKNFQQAWYDSTKQIKALFAANQVGKTTFGSITTISAALGVKPLSLGGKLPERWEDIDRKGKLFLVCGESFQTAISKTIIPKLREFLSDDMIEDSKNQPSSKVPNWYRTKSGAEIHIMSYDQDPKGYEGPVWDGVWLDEPPPQNIFNAIWRGIMARSGWITITATPLSEPWMHEVIVEPSTDPSDPMFAMCDVFHAEMEDNCVLEGSMVSGRFTGGLKAKYSGPAVEVETKNGNRLRVTAHHPVLTARGIVLAGSLHEGDTLLCKQRDVVGPGTFRHVNEEECRDTLAREVFEALGAHGIARRKCADLDLYGDQWFIRSQEVDAVGLLMRSEERRLVNPIRKRVGELGLVYPNASFSRSFPALDKGASPSSFPGFLQSSLDNIPIKSNALPSRQLRAGSISQLDSVLPESATKCRGVATAFFGETLERFSGLITPDEVRKVRQFDYVGHVYDFSTEVGYFASDNVIVKNCRDHNNGAIPHEQIVAYLAKLPPKEREARQFGLFKDLQGREFPYVTRETHVVADLW